MKGNGAEVAGAEATTVMRDRKTDLFNCRHAARRIVVRMAVPHVRERVYAVQFLPLQRRHRRVGHQHLVVIIFHHRTPGHRVLVVVLDPEGTRIRFPILPDL